VVDEEPEERLVSEAKAEILARLRGALAAPGRGAGPVPRDYHDARAGAVRPAAGPAEGGEPATAVELDRLVDRLVDYKAQVRRTDAAGVAGAVAAALAERGVGRLLVPAGLPAEWLAEVPADRLVGDQPPLDARALDATDGVLTGCAVAVATTGTIVLDAGPGQGRRALTLVPDYHLCVVLADQVVAGVPAAVARLDPRRPQTWISGPSATSDIEFNRVEGVHGPRTLEVVLVS
jgi:L-lactate dehydrogenase complex protein LldG